MIDIQSFIWVQGSDEYASRGVRCIESPSCKKNEATPRGVARLLTHTALFVRRFGVRFAGFLRRRFHFDLGQI
jgi:hypothetical protein